MISKRKLIFARAGMRTSGMSALGLHWFRRSLLCDATPRLADFSLDLSHFIWLDVGGKNALPFCKRFFPFHCGHFWPAGFSENIAQVQVHCRVVRIALQQSLRFIQPDTEFA